MNLIKPKKLKIGDTIGIIAPAGAVDRDLVLKAKKFFENCGYNVKLGKHIFNTDNYMAGKDNERLYDLHNAFSDKEINAIICARGGYGALRLVNLIDYDLISKNPKIFVGFSDITILNTMFLKKSGLISFSGPMAQSDFSSDNINLFTKDSFFKSLMSENFEIYAQNYKSYSSVSNAEGILIGGNLSTLASLCGLDFVPNEKFILFIEDLGEPVYKIDRYLTQLLTTETFRKNLSAIVLGDFLDIDDNKYFDNLFENLSQMLNIPIACGFPFSHTDVKTTVPVGAYSFLNGDKITVQNYLDV